MIKKLAVVLLLIGFKNHGISQSNFEDHSAELKEYLDNWYNEESGLWNSTSWWNGANVLTVLIEHAKMTNNQNFKAEIAEIFEKTKKFEVPASENKEAWICENYINDYYDDEGWWALAWLDAWEFTGEDQYLEMSTIIFNDIITGWSEMGGLYWKKGLSYRSSISNGLVFTLATRLYLAHSSNDNDYLEWAMKIWGWMDSSHLLNEEGNMQDGVRIKDGVESLSTNIWTYNQGVVLTGLANMYRIKGQQEYLKSAHLLASATLKNMTDENNILVELNCEPYKCNADAKQFKGIFMRHLSVLNSIDPKDSYSEFIFQNANSIWNMAMIKGKVAPGVVWSAPSESNAATVSSAFDVFNAALKLKSRN